MVSERGEVGRLLYVYTHPPTHAHMHVHTRTHTPITPLQPFHPCIASCRVPSSRRFNFACSCNQSVLLISLSDFCLKSVRLWIMRDEELPASPVSSVSEVRVFLDVAHPGSLQQISLKCRTSFSSSLNFNHNGLDVAMSESDLRMMYHNVNSED